MGRDLVFHLALGSDGLTAKLVLAGRIGVPMGRSFGFGGGPLMGPEGSWVIFASWIGCGLHRSWVGWVGVAEVLFLWLPSTIPSVRLHGRVLRLILRTNSTWLG